MKLSKHERLIFEMATSMPMRMRDVAHSVRMVEETLTEAGASVQPDNITGPLTPLQLATLRWVAGSPSAMDLAIIADAAYDRHTRK